MTRTVLCLLFAFAACGGSDAPATTPATGEEPAPAASEPVESPAAAAAACDQEVALACADGFADGCLSKLTLVHVCVATSEEKAGPPPCKQEIARQCPDGQVDACLSTPPMAANHVCVLAPK
jgi:hypothetical protein